jgi:hypothetical protein
MRKQSLVVLAAVLFAGSASAAPTDFTGTLSVFIGTLPPIESTETGVADFTDPQNFSLPGGTFDVQTTIPITDPGVMGTIPSIRATYTNGPGTFVGGAGPMPINGQSLVCLFVVGCSVNVTVPFDTPTAAFGVGGTIIAPPGAAVAVTLARLGPWTTGTAVASGPTTMGGTTVVTRMGGVAGNTVTLVTPISVLTSLTTTFPFLPGFGELTIEFAPEPGSAALFAGVLVGLFAVGRRRRQS